MQAYAVVYSTGTIPIPIHGPMDACSVSTCTYTPSLTVLYPISI